MVAVFAFDTHHKSVLAIAMGSHLVAMKTLVLRIARIFPNKAVNLPVRTGRLGVVVPPIFVGINVDGVDTIFG